MQAFSGKPPREKPQNAAAETKLFLQGIPGKSPGMLKKCVFIFQPLGPCLVRAR